MPCFLKQSSATLSVDPDCIRDSLRFAPLPKDANMEGAEGQFNRVISGLSQCTHMEAWDKRLDALEAAKGRQGKHGGGEPHGNPPLAEPTQARRPPMQERGVNFHPSAHLQVWLIPNPSTHNHDCQNLWVVAVMSMICTHATCLQRQ